MIKFSVTLLSQETLPLPQHSFQEHEKGRGREIRRVSRVALMESSFPNSLAASNCMRLSFERNRCTSSGRSASYTNAAEEGSRNETKLRGLVNAEAPDRIGKKPRRRTHHPIPVDDGQRLVQGHPRLHALGGGLLAPPPEGAVAAGLANFHRHVLAPLPPRLSLDRRSLEVASAELRPLARPQRHGSARLLTR
jgi:hypothetical protein